MRVDPFAVGTELIRSSSIPHGDQSDHDMVGNQKRDRLLIFTARKWNQT